MSEKEYSGEMENFFYNGEYFVVDVKTSKENKTTGEYKIPAKFSNPLSVLRTTIREDMKKKECGKRGMELLEELGSRELVFTYNGEKIRFRIVSYENNNHLGEYSVQFEFPDFKSKIDIIIKWIYIDITEEGIIEKGKTVFKKYVRPKRKEIEILKKEIGEKFTISVQ